MHTTMDSNKQARRESEADINEIATSEEQPTRKEQPTSSDLVQLVLLLLLLLFGLCTLWWLRYTYTTNFTDAL